MSNGVSNEDETKAVKELRAALEAIPLIEIACIGAGGTETQPMLYVYLKTPACRGSKLPKGMGRYRVEYINGSPRPAATAAAETPKAETPKSSSSSRVGSAK